ncbi:MAG: hypothetical protein QW521_04735 [Desulfurococcaceae archaeon]
MRGQSESLGVVVLALVLASTLTTLTVMYQYQVSAVRSVREAASVLAERKAEVIAFDYINGSIYASPSVGIRVLCTVVYNSTHVIYSNDTPYTLAPGSWSSLSFMPSSVSQLVVEGSASLALLTDTGSLITWIPPVTRVERRTTLVEEMPKAWPVDVRAFNNSLLLYLTYDHGYYRYQSSSTSCSTSRFFNANSPLASMIVFYRGSLDFSEEVNAVVQGSSVSVVQNFTVSSSGGYLKASYKWSSSCIGSASRRLSYTALLTVEASGLSLFKKALVLVLLNNTLAYMYVDAYAMPDGSIILPIIAYADGGSVSGSAAYAKIVVLEPVSQINMTLTVELFKLGGDNLEVVEVVSRPIAIAAVDVETRSFASYALALAPAIVITHVSSAGYALYSNPPVSVEYSRSSGAVRALVESNSWSFSVEDPWISYGSFQNRWTTATANVSTSSVEVPVTAVSWQSIEKSCSTPQLTQPTPPQPAPILQPPLPQPTIYAILDPMPTSSSPITVDVYVISSRVDTNLLLKYMLVNEETNQVIEGTTSFNYINTPLGVKWSVKLTLLEDAKRRVEISVLYANSVIAAHLYRNYVP